LKAKRKEAVVLLEQNELQSSPSTPVFRGLKTGRGVGCGLWFGPESCHCM